MLELVFVIVVIGILAAAILPRMDRDVLYEASEKLQAHIKYAQHLAMTDNVYDDSEQNWFYERWKIDLSNPSQYAISKGDSGGSFFGTNTIAEDPLTRQPMNGAVNDEYDLDSKFNVTFASTDGTTADGVLSFDHLGRPHYIASGGGEPASAVADVMTNDLQITLTDANGDTATITVTAETGYTSISFP